MELSPGAGKALALIGLVPVAYKTHQIEGALPHLAQRAQELLVPTWLLIFPILLLLVINVWFLRRLWERARFISSIFLIKCIGFYWWNVPNLELGRAPDRNSPTSTAWLSLFLLALAVGVWYYEKREEGRKSRPQDDDERILAGDSTQVSPHQPTTEPIHVTMPK
ncbi:MAG: hypothetical protein K1X67_09985 [Fimbriimonadaceae bacterium]|nr:hypothetical protein [Fimbriimonadaceae bacterium]